MVIRTYGNYILTRRRRISHSRSEYFTFAFMQIFHSLQGSEFHCRCGRSDSCICICYIMPPVFSKAARACAMTSL